MSTSKKYLQSLSSLLFSIKSLINLDIFPIYIRPSTGKFYDNAHK